MTSISGCNLCLACPPKFVTWTPSTSLVECSLAVRRQIFLFWVSELEGGTCLAAAACGVWKVSHLRRKILRNLRTVLWTRHEMSLLGKWDEEGVAAGLFLERVIVLSSCRSPIIHEDLFELMNYNLLRQNVGQIEWWWWRSHCLWKS